MSKLAQPRPRPLRGHRLDRLRRSQVALVRHLRPDRRCVAVSGWSGKGLNLGIEFEGGVEYQVSMPAGQADQANVEKIRDAVAQTAEDEDIDAAASPIVNTSGSDNIRVQTEPLDQRRGRPDLRRRSRRPPASTSDDISQDAIGATWGAQVANRALLGSRWSSWSWSCCSSGPTSASGRCPSARSWRWRTTW